MADDDSRLREVLAERREESRSFFGRIGADWDRVRNDLFGLAFTAEALLGFIASECTVADLGCGTGNASELLAPHVKRVIAVDREQAMITAARKRLGGTKNVEFRQGDLLDLPLEDGEADAAMIFLVLHHVDDPAACVTEIARTLRLGGMLLAVDMVAHDRDSYRHTMGHRHLGFDETVVKTWASAAGLETPRYRRLRPDTTAKGPGLFVATMRKSK